MWVLMWLVMFPEFVDESQMSMQISNPSIANPLDIIMFEPQDRIEVVARE